MREHHDLVSLQDGVPENVVCFLAEDGATDALADIVPDLDAVVVVVLNAAQTQSVMFDDAGLTLPGDE